MGVAVLHGEPGRGIDVEVMRKAVTESIVVKLGALDQDLPAGLRIDKNAFLVVVDIGIQDGQVLSFHANGSAVVLRRCCAG
jgi:hypothetical protein